MSNSIRCYAGVGDEEVAHRTEDGVPLLQGTLSGMLEH